MLAGLIVAALLATPSPDEAPPPAPPDVQVLAAEVRAIRPSEVAGLIASDPRFAALDPPARAALLRAVAIDWRWHVAASAGNFLVGFGIGSLLEGDRRGLVLTVSDAVAGVVMIVAVAGLASGVEGGGSGELVAAAPVAVAVLLAGRVAGLILPWTWDGKHHAAASRALGSLPPPAPRGSALQLAPLVASTTGRAAPGLTVLLRF